MKIAGREIERFMAAPPKGLRAVLLFGENQGLVRELGDRLTASVVPNPKDAERIVDLGADQIRKDAARLADEAAQMSMFAPGRRVVRVRDASEGMGEIFDAFLKTATGDALILVDAGELNARASLRTVFEAAPQAAAIACYDDTLETLVELAAEIIRKETIKAERDVLELLVQRLGLERRVIRAELVKLALYFGAPIVNDPTPRILTRDLVETLFGQSGEVESSEITAAMALGDHVRLDAMLLKAEEAGASATQIVSASLRHMHALLAAKAMGTGEDVAAARQRGLWGMSDTMIRAQLLKWTPDRLAAAVRILGRAEADTRTTILPDWPLASRALLHTARLVR